ncbi:glutamate--tRNA ligase [Candidatus Uhrbacteria bacterium]|nr:glutamate--tRNA ligase [Candidatus Uhrbacteria bacterium]
MIRTRMAPSPTGFLHIGTARTALFNYLFARKHGGRFVLRIEDTDKDRSRREFEADIIEGLHWLGIHWDEGPDVGGPHGPYRQSERITIYKKYLMQLYEQDLVYSCYCTQEELERERELQMLAKQPPRYSGICRGLSDAKRKTLEGQGRTSVLRFKTPQRVVSIADLIRGDITFDTATLDDMIIAKNIETPLFNFAVVIDDFLMNITHVIRGEDHISNTPKQLLLGESLGFSAPLFGHLPLILNTDRTKLSKRQNKVSLLEYKNEGYLSEAIVNFLVLLGWSAENDRELFSLDELENIFSLDRVHKAGAVFNLAKLDWFNAHYIRATPIDILTARCIPFLVDAHHITHNDDGSYTITATQRTIEINDLRQIVSLEQQRMKKLSGCASALGYLFVDQPHYDASLLAWKGMTLDDVVAQLLFLEQHLSEISEDQFTSSIIEQRVKEAIALADKKNGEVLWPFRVALTGQTASPSPFDIAPTLGKTLTLRRIAYARERARTLQ